MKISKLKEILNGFNEDLPVVFLSSENNLDFYYQTKGSIKYEIVHINDEDIDDERIFIKEQDYDEFYDKIVNCWACDLTDEEIEEKYEKLNWTKVLLITLDD